MRFTVLFLAVLITVLSAKPDSFKISITTSDLRVGTKNSTFFPMTFPENGTLFLHPDMRKTLYDSTVAQLKELEKRYSSSKREFNVKGVEIVMPYTETAFQWRIARELTAHLTDLGYMVTVLDMNQSKQIGYRTMKEAIDDIASALESDSMPLIFRDTYDHEEYSRYLRYFGQLRKFHREKNLRAVLTGYSFPDDTYWCSLQPPHAAVGISALFEPPHPLIGMPHINFVRWKDRWYLNSFTTCK